MTSVKLPRVTGDEALRALLQAGFEVVRVKGSHHFLSHPQDRTRWATVPAHSARDLPPGVLYNILKSARLTVEEFKMLL